MKNKMGDSGCIPVICEAMKKYASQSGVQVNGAAVLQSLVTLPKNVEQMAQNDAASILKVAVEQHPFNRSAESHLSTALLS